MSEALPDPKKAATLSLQIVELLTDVDSETRVRAISSALTLLGEKSVEQESPPTPPKDQNGTVPTSFSEFIQSIEEKRNSKDALKPSDYVQLCAAYHFATYGTVPFSVRELQELAREAGVVLPGRPDMTLNSNKLYYSLGKGFFKPTVHAAMAFKKEWGLKPGTKSKSPAAPQR